MIHFYCFYFYFAIYGKACCKQNIMSSFTKTYSSSKRKIWKTIVSPPLLKYLRILCCDQRDQFAIQPLVVHSLQTRPNKVINSTDTSLMWLRCWYSTLDILILWFHSVLDTLKACKIHAKSIKTTFTYWYKVYAITIPVKILFPTPYCRL